MKLGVALPLIDVAVGGDPAAIREFAQTAEEIGYQDLSAPDHVLGVNVESRPDWGDRNTSGDLFHDPFVLFGFLANCTGNIEFSTQVLILAQRQAVLVAKQAASLDVLCGGRFRLGVGVGWNPVEFTGLNENFRNRGRRSEEQVEVMQALWAEPHVTFPADLFAHEAARDALREIVEKVWGYCERSGLRGRTVTLKVKFANSQQITRSRTSQMQIATKGELEQLGFALLEPLFPVTRGVRLLGISLSSLVGEDAGESDFSLPL